MLMTAIALVAMVSCNKDDNKNKGNKGNGGLEETELIAIDGSFDDWASLKGAATAEVDEDAPYPGLLSMKAIADATNIYIYFEYELQEDQGGAAPFSIYVNSDNACSTGSAYWMWAGDADEFGEGESVIPGIDYLLASDGGFLASETAVKSMDDIALLEFTGKDGEDIWTEGALVEKEVTSFFENAGKIQNGVVIMEVSFMRSVINCNKSGATKIGILVQNAAWGVGGVLPVGASAGAVEMLEVALP